MSVGRISQVNKCKCLASRDNPNPRITLAATIAKSYKRWPIVSFPITRLAWIFWVTRFRSLNRPFYFSALLTVRSWVMRCPTHVNGQKQRTCKRAYQSTTAYSTIAILRNETYWSNVLNVFISFYWTISRAGRNKSRIFFWSLYLNSNELSFQKIHVYLHILFTNIFMKFYEFYVEAYEIKFSFFLNIL